jgi:hypothetical protein
MVVRGLEKCQNGDIVPLQSEKSQSLLAGDPTDQVIDSFDVLGAANKRPCRGRELGKAFDHFGVPDEITLPWYFELLNINLENNDLAEAKRRIRLLAEAFRKDGIRITENLDFGGQRSKDQ